MPTRATTYRSTPPRPAPSEVARPDATQRGYDRRWKKRRAAHLAANPLCVVCTEQGLVVAATVADHITPHRGDKALFWGPLQSMCTRHHNQKTRKGG